MRVLTAPASSFGRDSDLLFRFRDVLAGLPLDIHCLRSDVDLNRTTATFSGDLEPVFEALEQMCRLAFDRIDLNHHVGAHSRTGALDLCPFVAYPESATPSSKLQLLKPSPGEDVAEQVQPQGVATQQVLFREVESFAARIAGLDRKSVV